MMGWVILNVATSVVVSMIVIFKLSAWPDLFNIGERVGMGAIGASMLMRCAPLIARNLFHNTSPFDDWSTLLLNVGLCCYFVGRMAHHFPLRKETSLPVR